MRRVLLNTMNFEEIKALLPHRYPMLLVDKVIEFEKSKYIKTLKNVSGNEEFFVGHFPSEAIMPGVLIVESMAQSCAILTMKSFADENGDMSEIKGKSVYFMSIENAKFRAKVVPGDTIIHTAMLTKQKGKICKFDIKTHVGESLVAEASIMAMIAD